MFGMLQGLPETMAVSISEALALYNLTAVQVGDRRGFPLMRETSLRPQSHNGSAPLAQHIALLTEPVAFSTCCC